MTSKFFKTKRTNSIRAEIEGEGYPVLCLSGVACSNYNFHDLRNDLKDKYQLVLVDNRGTGKSDALEGDYSLNDMAADGIEIMEQLGHKQYGVIGISMGGYIAQLVTLAAPTRVKSLALISTCSGGDVFVKPWGRSEAELIESYQLDIKERNKRFVAAFVHQPLKISNPKRFQEISDLREQNQESLQTAVIHFRAIDQFLETPIPIQTISCPTVVITGADDKLINPVNSGLLANMIPNAKLHVIKEANHLVYFEKHVEIANHIKNFFKTSLK
ncbi:MAG: alpha/beta fold hydrolase [Oligoflexales bacterium]